MLHITRILNVSGHLVDLLMTLRVDTSGDVDIENNWSSTNRTRNMDARIYFLIYL